MLPKDVIMKIRRFHFRTRHFADNLFAGRYESAFKGFGVEFAEVRPYAYGDDIRAVDWNVSARFGHPFVKLFHEERELTVLLVLDLSGSHHFGTRRRMKKELLAEISGMLASVAVRTNDRVGAILFSSGVEKYIPPKKGTAHVWRLIRDILTFTPRDPRTNIHGAMKFLNRVVKRRAVVFLISDYIDDGFEKSLITTAGRHDLTMIRLLDPAEERLPDVRYVNIKDPETNQSFLLNMGSTKLRSRWHSYRKEERKRLQQLARKAQANYLEISTDDPVVQKLSRYFTARSAKSRCLEVH